MGMTFSFQQQTEKLIRMEDPCWGQGGTTQGVTGEFM